MRLNLTLLAISHIILYETKIIKKSCKKFIMGIIQERIYNDLQLRYAVWNLYKKA